MKPSLYIDHDCAFCQKWGKAIAFILCGNKRLALYSIKYKETNTSIARYMQKHDSWVLVVGDERYAHFDAFIQLVAMSRWLFWSTPFWRFPFVRWAGIKMYRKISGHRNCKK